MVARCILLACSLIGCDFLVCDVLFCDFRGTAFRVTAQEPQPRIITCGWNAPTLGQFARDVDQMPGDLPITGSVLTLHASQQLTNDDAALFGNLMVGVVDQ